MTWTSGPTQIEAAAGSTLASLSSDPPSRVVTFKKNTLVRRHPLLDAVEGAPEKAMSKKAAWVNGNTLA